VARPARILGTVVVLSRPPSLPATGIVPLAGEPVDLRVRALVAGVVPAPRFAREAEVAATARSVAASGADVVDVSLDPRLVGPAAAAVDVPAAATVDSLEAAARAAHAGAALALVPPAVVAGAHGGDLAGAGATIAVVVADLAALAGAADVASRAGALLAFDATRLPSADALAAESLAMIDGCRILRTTDVRRTRRVAEVVATLLAARRGGGDDRGSGR
jgi:hypothetical protein